MINQNRRLLNTLNQIILTGFFVFCMVAVVGIIGCSSGGGGGGDNQTEYLLSGYNGVSDASTSGGQFIGSALGNSGLNFYSAFPGFVNLTFQVFDAQKRSVTDLVVEDFSVLEDGVEVDQINSEMNIHRRDPDSPDSLPSAYSYTIKTVLFLDNSPSTKLNLEKMIEAAQVVVEYMDEKQQQEIAIVAYDEAGDSIVIQDFTNDGTVLRDSLDSLERSSGTITDLYGAVKFSLALFEDSHTPASTEFVQGFVVVITDGIDTAGMYDVDDAIAARGDQQIITVAVGDVPEQALSDLELLGNCGYYPVPNPDQDPDQDNAASQNPGDENLCEWMRVVQDKMIAYADGFYWIQYKSTATSVDANLDHTVALSIVNNGNDEVDGQILGSFSSEDFFSGETNIYFNRTVSDPDGLFDKAADANILPPIVIERGQGAGEVTREVTAKTYSFGSTDPSQYEWSSGDTSIATVKANPLNSAEATITVVAPGDVWLTVTDSENSVSPQSFLVQIKVREESFEMIQHIVTSKGPWFADATFQVRESYDETDYDVDNPWLNQWTWVTDLAREEMTVVQNGTAINMETSETHLRKRDNLPSAYTYTLKTVLLIDNSPSVGSGNLTLIKNAAKTFARRALINDPLLDIDIDSVDDPATELAGHYQQAIAIFSFDEDGNKKLIEPFSSDLDTINDAIDSIVNGFGPVSFYGAMLDSLNLWENNQDPYAFGNPDLVQGVVVVLSDGWESVGFFDRESVLAEIDDKQIICVGVGDDILSANNEEDLLDFGNAGFYPVADPGGDSGTVGYTQLEKTLMDIQDNIVDYANSFYWLDYKSSLDPVCGVTESMVVSINNNSNIEISKNVVSGSFSSCQFAQLYDGHIYINSTVTDPDGIDDVIDLAYVMLGNIPMIDLVYPLEAYTYDNDGIKNTSAYTWEWVPGYEDIVQVNVDTGSYAHSRATLTLPNNKMPGTAVLDVSDTGNGVDKYLTVNVDGLQLPAPIAYYPFNGNADDMTGNGYDGQAFGATLTADREGNRNSAYSFMGEGDYIALDMFYGTDEGAVSDSVDNLTVCAWVKTSSSQRSMRIVSFNYYSFWELYISEGHFFLGSIPYGESELVYTSNTFNDNKWHFVCATLDSAGESKVYVDGNSEKLTYVGLSQGPVEATRYGFIGTASNASSYNAGINPGGATFFDGSIDDVIIFDIVLTDGQIESLEDAIR